MNSVKKLDVIIDDIKIGTLAVADNHLCAFEYSDEWLAKGYSISPFSLPLEKKVFIPKAYTPFEGIFGIFADSLPDGWGRLLVDRLLMKNKINPYEVDAINRLAIVGKSGMGALEYYPENRFMQEEEKMSLDEIAAECGTAASVCRTGRCRTIRFIYADKRWCRTGRSVWRIPVQPGKGIQYTS